jgi:hypothetical protein
MRTVDKFGTTSSLYTARRKTKKEGEEPESVFVNLLRSPGIDSQPGGLVRQLYLSYTGPPGYIGLRNRFLRIDSWAT